MARARGISLSGSQVIASVLATLTAAVAASYLGVAGTLVGAAVGSLVSTVGNEIYKHYLISSQERIRAAGVLRQYRAAARSATSPQQAARTHQMARRPAAGDRAADPADAEQTQLIPGLADAWRTGTQPSGEPPASAAQRAAGDVGDDAGGRPGNGRADGARPWWQGISRRRWLTLGALAGGIFVLALAGITVFEASVGKPLDAAVWGRHSTGTTVGNAVTGHRAGPASPQPTSTGTPQPTTSASQSASPGATAPSSPVPTSVPSSAASTAPASGPTGSAAPTAGTSAAPTQGVPNPATQNSGTQDSGVQSTGTP